MNLNKTIGAVTLSALILSSGSLQAKVTDSEANKLSHELTPLGAERAGNADNSIPAWAGGMTTPPKGYQGEGTTRVDPFVEEKPLFTIDANNYKEYAAKLSDGQIALFEKYPSTFKMPVYSTHRTAAAPQYVYDNTKQNALRAELVSGGNGVEGAYGGIPFPIPSNGQEVIWNHLLRWTGEGATTRAHTLSVYEDGSVTHGEALLWESFPYFAKDGNLQSFEGEFYHMMLQYALPIRRKGEVILLRDPVNQTESTRQAWQYIPGQRRVRRAPTIAFDTPNNVYAGGVTYDDAWMFNGSPERFNWKLKGKKEMFISYNNNGLFAALENGEVNDLATPGHPNPDYGRWELHRVWEVEATLKEGSRHIYGKRTFYIDEDTWAIAATDIYDGRNELWRVGIANFLNLYDVPLTILRAYWHVDLQNSSWAMSDMDVEPLRIHEGEGKAFFTPAQVRKLSRR